MWYILSLNTRGEVRSTWFGPFHNHREAVDITVVIQPFAITTFGLRYFVVRESELPLFGLEIPQ